MKLSGSLTVDYQDDALCIARADRVQLTVYVQALRSAHIPAILRSAESHAQTRPDGIVCLVLVQPHAPMVETAVLQELRPHAQTLGHLYQHVAVAIVPHGPLSLLIKAATRAAAVMRGKGSQISLHDDLFAACRALADFAQHRGWPALDPAALKAQADEITALLRAPARRSA